MSVLIILDVKGEASQSDFPQIYNTEKCIQPETLYYVIKLAICKMKQIATLEIVNLSRREARSRAKEKEKKEGCLLNARETPWQNRRSIEKR